MNANTLRQPSDTRPFYETWYLTVRRPGQSQAIWLRYTLLRQADTPLTGGLWIARFDAERPTSRLAWRQAVPAAEIWAPPGGESLRLGSAVFGDGAAHGDLEADGHRAAWDLRWTRQKPPTLVPHYVRALHLNAADLEVASVAGRLDGEILLDDERIPLASAPVTQAHHWGRHYPDTWLWGHAHAFENAPDSWVEVLAVRRAAHGLGARPLVLLACRTPIGAWHPASPLDWLRAQATYEDGRWHVLAPFGKFSLSLEFVAAPDGFLAFPYASPRGRPYVCHNASLADASLRLYRGPQLLGHFHGAALAAAEFCTPSPAAPSSFLF